MNYCSWGDSVQRYHLKIEISLNPAQFFSLVDTMARLSLRAEARRFYFGYFWWVLEPLLYVAVFWLVFEKLLGTRTPDFLMFLAVGKLTFIWFSKTVNTAANSLVNNAGLIARMDLPKMIFPAVVVLECSYRQIAVFVLLAIFIFVDGRQPTAHWFWLFPIAVVQILLIVACAFIAALLVCVSRDFVPLISLGTIFLMFMSGVFWDLNTLADEHAAELLVVLNPLAYLLDAYRQALLWQQSPDITHLAAVGAILVAINLFLVKVMQRYSRHIARRVISQ